MGFQPIFQGDFMKNTNSSPAKRAQNLTSELEPGDLEWPIPEGKSPSAPLAAKLVFEKCKAFALENAKKSTLLRSVLVEIWKVYSCRAYWIAPGRAGRGLEGLSAKS